MRRALSYVSWSLLVLGATLTSPSPAVAQPVRTHDHIVPVPGALVRVSLPARPDVRRRRMTGTLLSLSRDSVTLATSPGQVGTVALDALERFEVSLGRERSVLSSVGAGTLIGASALAVVAATIPPDQCDGVEFCLLEYSRSDAAIFGGLVGAVIGAVAGGIVGAIRATDRWQPVTTSSLRSRLAFASVSLRPPLGQRAGMVARFRF